MLSLGPLGFAAPLALLALLAAPLVFWLARAVPPPPRRAMFPPLEILRHARQDEETPVRSPLWLTLLRLLAALLLVVGLAQPVFNPRPAEGDARPLVLVIDDGWTMAARWSETIAAAQALAEGARGPVRVIFASAAQGEPDALTAFEARARLDARDPVAWLPDLSAAARALAAAPQPARVVLFTDGLDRPGLGALQQAAARFGDATLIAPGRGGGVIALSDARVTADGLEVSLALGPDAPPEVTIAAGALDGRVFARQRVRLPAAAAATALVRLEPGLVGETGLARIDGAGAGGAFVLDAAARRPRVGIVSGEAQSAPLVSERFYLNRALEPYALLSEAGAGALAEAGVDAILLPDSGPLPDADEGALLAWVDRGGVLVRFAGPRLAEAPGEDRLLPAPLRDGARSFGGGVAWEEAQAIASYPPESPFAGLSPPADVKVRAQVLGEPGGEAAIWATLADGSPLVSAARRDKGLIVLFHAGATPAWSDLPYSGAFVGLLRRTLLFAGRSAAGAEITGAGPFQPRIALDGFGRLVAPGRAARAIPAEAFAAARPGPTQPPGLYQRGGAVFALNAGRFASLRPAPAPPPGLSAATQAAAGPAPVTLGPFLLTGAIALLAADLLIALWIAGRLKPPRQAAAGLAGALLITPLLFHPVGVRASDAALAEAAGAFQLAYVRTGDPATDGLAEAGLRGLSRALNARTSVAAAPPRGVTPGRDPLALYPLIYWLLPENPQPLSPEAARALDQHLRTGGMLFIDTRGAGRAGGGSAAIARRALAGLSLPALAPVGGDHVLSKTFYILRAFPGRYQGARLYVERAAAADLGNDGVSGLIVGDGEWAAAWAIDAQGRPALPVEGGERQRELAYRVGVNLTLYALTGNYKTDQVHVPALLERMAQ
jgi:hypothetical protein